MTPRTWDVLLVGGAAGTGKTSVSSRLARHFSVGLAEVDDFHLVLETLTTPEQLPLLHFWKTNPSAARLTAAEIVDLHISVGRLLLPAVRAVIANHIETEMPLVLEGDYLLPELLIDDTFDRERVRGVYLYEPDEAQILANFAGREPAAGAQAGRARVSWLFGEWLREDCSRLGLPTLPVRPWDTLLARVIATIENFPGNFS